VHEGIEGKERGMNIRIGYDMVYACPQPVPMVLMLNIHHSRVSDVVVPDHVRTDPPVRFTSYRDGFGNWCGRIVAPAGDIRIYTEGVVRDSGLPDVVAPDAQQLPIEDLPEETLVYLLGSRYCETDRLIDEAWRLFGQTRPGWTRVQAICEFVHGHIKFGYEFARRTKSAWEAYNERAGVCRDYAHLGLTFCRCMNIPARYCTGYLGDIGVPVSPEPMDFSGWFEAFLGGRWYAFDPRNLVPRIGRVLIARGRDASDVAIATTFGPNVLKSFVVQCEEIPET
jgi:transglutaminase-like putative cysteine protease